MSKTEMMSNKIRLLSMLSKDSYDLYDLNEIIFLFETFIQEQFRLAKREPMASEAVEDRGRVEE